MFHALKSLHLLLISFLVSHASMKDTIKCVHNQIFNFVCGQVRLTDDYPKSFGYFCDFAGLCMRGVNHLLISIFLSLFISNTFSQEWQTVTIPIEMQVSANNGSTPTQFILHSLSPVSGDGDLVASLRNTIQFKTLLKQSESSLAEIHLNIHNQTITGNTTYRNFDMAGVLQPDFFKGRIYLHSMFGTTEERKFEAQADSLTDDYFLGTVNTRAFPVKEARLEFDFSGFTAKAREQFEAHLHFINTYWAAANYLDTLFLMAEKQEEKIANDTKTLFVFWDKLRKGLKLGNRILNSIHGMQFSEPSNSLETKLKAAERLTTRYETLLIASLGRRYADAQLTTDLVHHYIETIQHEQQQIIRQDFRNHDFLTQVLRIQSDEIFAYILEKLSPKSDPQMAAALLLGGLVHFADTYYEKQDLATALRFYEDARLMNRHYDFVNDSTTLNERIDAAKLGILQSHLQIAAKAVEVGNNQLANTYRDKSNAFVKEKLNEQHIAQLPDQSENLIENYLKKANELIDQKMYPQAISVLEDALTAAANFFNIRHNEKINQSLFAAHRAIFTEQIQTVEDLIRTESYADALQHLQQAEEYRQEHIDFLRNSSEAIHLRSKLEQLMVKYPMNAASTTEQIYSNPASMSAAALQAKTLIVGQLKEAQLKAWANEIDAAMQLYESVLETRSQYHLESDSDIAHAMKELDNRLIDRICLNNIFRIDELMEKLRKEIYLKNPDHLEPILQEIIEIGVNNQGCRLKIDEAQQIYAFYQPYFKYQADYRHIIETVYTKGVKQAIPLYLSMDQSIESYQLDRFGVKHIDLFDFLHQQNNAKLSLDAIEYFVDRMNAESIALLYTILLTQDFNREQSKDLQQRSGIILAIAHWNAGALNSYEQIIRITANDRRLHYLQQSYLRAAKSIKKENRL